MKYCHCCGSNYRKIQTDVYACTKCDHIYRDYLGESTDYHIYNYRKLERRNKHEINDQLGVIEHEFHELRLPICLERLKIILPYLSNSYSCLDIGAGGGTFANLLRPFIKKIECTELDLLLLKELNRLELTTYSEDFLLTKFNKKYDVTFAWHVLEHVPSCKLFIEKMANLTNSLAVLEIPTLKSYFKSDVRQRKLTSPNSGYYDGHCHYFSAMSLKFLVENYFDILYFDEGIQSPSILAILRPK